MLPRALGEACALFDKAHERDVFLTALLSALSAGLPNVEFEYGAGAGVPRIQHPNIFAFIVGPPASGKGVAQAAFDWLNSIDGALVAEHSAAWESWERRARAYEEDPEGADPPGPEPRPLYVQASADTTHAGLFDALVANRDGVGLFSTEADVLTSASRREFGDFSSLIRQAFHHETAAQTRRGTGRAVIARPRLSLCLTGTPDQFPRLVERGVKDGLFSRFAVFSIDSRPAYVSQRPDSAKGERSRTTFDRGRAEAFRIWQALRARGDRSLPFRLADQHWDVVDAMAREAEGRLDPMGELAASIRRGALTAVRVSCVLGVWRAHERGLDLGQIDHIDATSDDVAAATQIVGVYLQHAVTLSSGAPRDDGPARLLNALPDEFSTPAVYREVGGSLGASQSSFYRWLGRLREDGAVEQMAQGRYRKTAPAKTENPENIGSGGSTTPHAGDCASGLPALPGFLGRFRKGDRVSVRGVGTGRVVQPFTGRLRVLLDGHSETMDFEDPGQVEHVGR